MDVVLSYASMIEETVSKMAPLSGQIHKCVAAASAIFNQIEVLLEIIWEFGLLALFIILVAAILQAEAWALLHSLRIAINLG